jgi:hypothetical protein
VNVRQCRPFYNVNVLSTHINNKRVETSFAKTYPIFGNLRSHGRDLRIEDVQSRISACKAGPYERRLVESAKPVCEPKNMGRTTLQNKSVCTNNNNNKNENIRTSYLCEQYTYTADFHFHFVPMKRANLTSHATNI